MICTAGNLLATSLLLGNQVSVISIFGLAINFDEMSLYLLYLEIDFDMQVCICYTSDVSVGLFEVITWVSILKLINTCFCKYIGWACSCLVCLACSYYQYIMMVHDAQLISQLTIVFFPFTGVFNSSAGYAAVAASVHSSKAILIVSYSMHNE